MVGTVKVFVFKNPSIKPPPVAIQPAISESSLVSAASICRTYFTSANAQYSTN